jgi:hypothetical protein
VGGRVGWLGLDDAKQGTFQDGCESLQELGQGMAAIAVKVGHNAKKRQTGEALSLVWRMADG